MLIVSFALRRSIQVICGTVGYKEIHGAQVSRQAAAFFAEDCSGPC
jgi:hypothetical protein